MKTPMPVRIEIARNSMIAFAALITLSAASPRQSARGQEAAKAASKGSSNEAAKELTRPVAKELAEPAGKEQSKQAPKTEHASRSNVDLIGSRSIWRAIRRPGSTEPGATFCCSSGRFWSSGSSGRRGP